MAKIDGLGSCHGSFSNEVTVIDVAVRVDAVHHQMQVGNPRLGIIVEGGEVLRVLDVRLDKIPVLAIWCLGHLVEFIDKLLSKPSPVIERPSVALVHGWGNLNAYGRLVNGLPCELLPEAIHVEHHLVPHAHRRQILSQ